MLELRTKPTVEVGITYLEKIEETRTTVVEYQPGDGSSYRLIFSALTGLSLESLKCLGLENWPNIVVTLVNNLEIPDGSMITRWGAYIDHVRVGACFGTGLPSSITLAELIAHLIDGTAMSCEEAQDCAKRGEL